MSGDFVDQGNGYYDNTPVVSDYNLNAISPGVSPHVSPVPSPMMSPRAIFVEDVLASGQPQQDEMKVSDVRISSENGLRNQIDFGRLLYDKGYKVLDKILIEKQKQGKNGEIINGIIIEAVKVLTPNRKKIYISLDCDNDDAIYIVCATNDISLKKSNAPYISFSERSGMADLIGMGLYGIVITYGGDVCIIKREHNGRIIENNYVLDDTVKNEINYYHKYYPLIKYSDLYSDPTQLMKLIDNEYIRINTKERMKNDLVMMNFSKTMEELYNTYKNMAVMYADKRDCLDENLHNFKNNIEYYKTYPPQSAAEEKLYNDSITGLEYSELKYDELIDECNQFNPSQNINNALKIINECSTLIDQFKNNPLLTKFRKSP